MTAGVLREARLTDGGGDGTKLMADFRNYLTNALTITPILTDHRSNNKVRIVVSDFQEDGVFALVTSLYPVSVAEIW